MPADGEGVDGAGFDPGLPAEEVARPAGEWVAESGGGDEDDCGAEEESGENAESMLLVTSNWLRTPQGGFPGTWDVFAGGDSGSDCPLPPAAALPISESMLKPPPLECSLVKPSVALMSPALLTGTGFGSTAWTGACCWGTAAPPPPRRTPPRPSGASVNGGRGPRYG
jgi:hypothetical protein